MTSPLFQTPCPLPNPHDLSLTLVTSVRHMRKLRRRQAGSEKTAGTQSFAVLDEGIGSDSKVSMMVSLMDALYAALRIFISDAKDLPVIVHKKEFPGGIVSISQGYFNIDESLGGEVKFALTYYDLGHVGNMVNLIDPNNRVLETIHLQEEDGDVNTIFITVTNAMPGNWRYRVENRADSHQSLYMRVWATPRAPNTTSLSSTPDNAITLIAWTSNWNSPIDVADIKNPVVVYAKVWWGESPVVGAKVEASLQRLGVNSTGSRYAPVNFLLLDNGSGDADVTRNDGIYSRYLPPVEAPASRYTLSVILTDNGGSAQIIVSSHPHMDPPRPYVSHIPYSGQVAVGGLGAQYTRAHTYDPAWPRCCGSVVPYNTGRPTGSLYRTNTVGLVDLKGGEHSLSHLPPSRVGDFRAEINPAVRQVTFYWTAPGDRRDHGSAMQYEVVFSRNAAATGQGSGETAPEWSPPSDVGTPSSHTVRWGRHDGVYYVAIRAISKTQVPGPWSNTAELFMPHPPTTTENIRGSTQGGAVSGSVSELGVTTPRPASLTTRNILTIVGVVCGILVVILIMAVYYLVVVSRRRRQQQEKQAIDVLEPVTTTPAACDTDSETDSITKPPAPPEALAVGDAEVTNKRAMSPIQSWPASTLLAEHEKRRPQDLPDGVESGEMNLPQPDLGVPQYMPNIAPCPPHPFYYHTPNGHYIEDNLAMDTGSMVSTQPSDSLLMYKVDSNTSDYTHPPSSSIAPTPVSWEGGRRPGSTKVPPPTPPKPTLSAHLTLGGVASTPVGQERKRRNVTQV
ncbi:hypothetical protein Pcinc_037065 [Petrolisthes cinctipes]|uniref:Fibronectin type-III domain-containing protein n=1 Tax=Petrolisthes cinctipes TaxID=88211 RepID=A0AAE1BTA7_PETCI|nr:hypothetical protein Pcinc_037065 [Petrolisthes cinctipes]